MNEKLISLFKSSNIYQAALAVRLAKNEGIDLHELLKDDFKEEFDNVLDNGILLKLYMWFEFSGYEFLLVSSNLSNPSSTSHDLTINISDGRSGVIICQIAASLQSNNCNTDLCLQKILNYIDEQYN